MQECHGFSAQPDGMVQARAQAAGLPAAYLVIVARCGKISQPRVPLTEISPTRNALLNRKEIVLIPCCAMNASSFVSVFHQ